MLNTNKKLDWQRKKRKDFAKEHGFSMTSNYSNGGLREEVLKRDGYSCVKCGMTDLQHKQEWNRPITVDHIDKNRRNNTLDNLQTLCLRCHGKKDILPKLTMLKVAVYKDEIISRRKDGETYQYIADSLGFSIASIWKWFKRWEGGEK